MGFLVSGVAYIREYYLISQEWLHWISHDLLCVSRLRNGTKVKTVTFSDMPFFLSRSGLSRGTLLYNRLKFHLFIRLSTLYANQELFSSFFLFFHWNICIVNYHFVLRIYSIYSFYLLFITLRSVVPLLNTIS